MISLGSITICIFASILLVLYICIILRQKSIFVAGIRLILGGISLILLRLLLPINFPVIRIDIPVTWIMPNIQLFLQQKFTGKIMIAHIILGVAGVGSLISLFIKINKHVKMMRLLKQAVYFTEIKKKEHIQQFFSLREIKKIQIAILYGQKDIVPFITGLLKPTLVLPDQNFSDKELYYIIRHELEHYRNRDLWLKALMEFLISIYWWNPFMYIFRKNFYLALEVSNDMKTTYNIDALEKIFYAECLYHIASDSYLIETQNGYDLYIDDNYMTTLTSLPQTIKLKIYKENKG